MAHTKSSRFSIEMLAELSQIKLGPLHDYYNRATSFLRLINVSDRSVSSPHATLSGAEDMILNMLIKTFFSGFEDQKLRHSAVSRGATCTSSL